MKCVYDDNHFLNTCVCSNINNSDNKIIMNNCNYWSLEKCKHKMNKYECSKCTIEMFQQSNINKYISVVSPSISVNTEIDIDIDTDTQELNSTNKKQKLNNEHKIIKQCKCTIQKRRCKKCGVGYCEHKRQKSKCKDCGNGQCVHNRNKYDCKECGTGRCDHGNNKYTCKECTKEKCEHNGNKHVCRKCKKIKKILKPQ
jgi:hypothetical protein